MEREKIISIVKEWDGSELSQKEYCHNHQLSLSQFHYWRKKLRGKNDDFISVQSGMAANSIIEITYPNGITLRIPSMSSSAILLQLVGME